MDADPNPGRSQGKQNRLRREAEARDEADRQAVKRGFGRSSRHMRPFFPGGRMYGEDDSVVAYFAGHALRRLRALKGLVVRPIRKPRRDEDDTPDLIDYRDYDG